MARRLITNLDATTGLVNTVQMGPSHPRSWQPTPKPSYSQTQNIDDDLAGPESISLDEIDAAFALLEHEKESMERVLIDRLDEVLEGQVYDFVELECVDQGLLPKFVDDKIIVVDHSAKDDEW
jgi:hypothetical protein